ncbi:hypothetical protein SESBI_34653 [Sesbania bispinosa]|nr:hypothetical protein SESBI_34653 [Sesbania bispinosa]
MTHGVITIFDLRASHECRHMMPVAHQMQLIGTHREPPFLTSWSCREMLNEYH